MNDFIIMTKVCFKTLAYQSTKRHNPTHTQTEAQHKQPPIKAPRRATRVPTEVSIPMEFQHSQGRQKRKTVPTRDPQRLKIHSQNYDTYFTIKQISLKYVHWSESDNHPEESNINDLFILIHLFCDA